MTPKEKAERLWIECYPSFYDNGQFMKGIVAKDYANLPEKHLLIRHELEHGLH